MGVLNDLNSIFGKEKGNKLLRNIVILGMVGTLLLLFGDIFSSNPQPVTDNKPVITEEKNNYLTYEESLSKELEEIISVMSGVGKVKVQVYTLKGPEYSYVYDQNITNKITEETDQNGGQRQIQEDTTEKSLVVLQDAAGGEEPLISTKQSPVISGVLIVAQGAEDSEIKYNITKSVSRLLDIPVHKISVLPYKRR
ncbi:Sporulation stage III protein AG [Halothermothrix orenii]|uniref:Sporulation stage III protein AG n=1 Tax=Halothermothrix orenii (strain H 168 / OCM 544 / DSM 9562) TaxID=373903 RepID=B8D2F3_HALOH|nr:Sporulation stage III protein AG [Halothermothrix orenii]ACL69380.1 Sporulation stage III protein AG [Halothermothrix orenii H 168]